MTRPLFFAANWKMNLAPGEARTFLDRFLAIDHVHAGRTLAFFPPAVSLATVAAQLRGHQHCVVGCQDLYWEPKGAFTGATSVHLARGAGADATLVGHSERRHVFGETDQDTQRKVRAALDGGLMVVLCVGETLAEREAGNTEAVVTRQLRVGLAGVESGADLVIAYEPVWAIGTGRNAAPSDAAVVHAAIRGVLVDMGLRRDTRVLYGGSVNTGNIKQLLAESEVDGVLVGGASLDPDSWAAICAAG
ncbi:MAG TPA: triose-phosphate isomerase [Gemmatimonadales bacterium]|jgi:triosephosphate isomerase|nr:triose-phosphate isomerase [Gemmatimonadales bacterium]